MFKNLMAVMAILVLAGPALAVTPALGTPVCADGTTCLVDGADRVLLERTNSGIISNAYLIVPTGTANDTGDEVAALLSLTCVDVITLDEGASGTADGGELVAGTCSTDIDAGTGLAIMFAK